MNIICVCGYFAAVISVPVRDPMPVTGANVAPRRTKQIFLVFSMKNINHTHNYEIRLSRAVRANVRPR